MKPQSICEQVAVRVERKRQQLFERLDLPRERYGNIPAGPARPETVAEDIAIGRIEEARSRAADLDRQLEAGRIECFWFDVSVFADDYFCLFIRPGGGR